MNFRRRISRLRPNAMREQSGNFGFASETFPRSKSRFLLTVIFSLSLFSGAHATVYDLYFIYNGTGNPSPVYLRKISGGSSQAAALSALSSASAATRAWELKGKDGFAFWAIELVSQSQVYVFNKADFPVSPNTYIYFNVSTGVWTANNGLARGWAGMHEGALDPELTILLAVLDECPGSNSQVEFRVGGKKFEVGRTLGAFPAQPVTFQAVVGASAPSGALVEAYVGGVLVASGHAPSPFPGSSATIDLGTVVVGRGCDKPAMGNCVPCFTCTPKLIAEVDSLNLEIQLGRADALGVPLALRLKSDSLAGLGNAAIELTGGLSSAVETIGEASDPRRQVAAPQWLADIEETRDGGGVLEQIEITLYHGKGAKAGGFYPGSNQFKTFALTPGSAAGTNSLVVEEISGGETNTSTYTHVPSTGAWTLVTDSGARKVSLTEATSGATRTVTREIRDATNGLVAKQDEVYTAYGWGERLTGRVQDPDGLALEETWQYETNNALPGYQRLSFRSEADGFWERFTYDTEGRVTKLVSSYLNAPSTAAESECRVLNTTYDGESRTEWEILRGQEVSRRHVIVTTTNAITTERVEVCTVPGAAIGATNSLVTTKVFSTNGSTVTHPDGTVTQTSMAVLSGNGLRTTTEVGKAASGEVVDGTRTVVDQDSRGNLVASTTTDIASNTVIASATTSDADDFGRPGLIEYLDGSSQTQFFGCCGLEESTDRDGVFTLFEPDDFGNVGTETVAGITTTYQYDPLGRLRRVIRTGSDDVPITVGGADYNLAGRQTAAYGLLGTTEVSEVTASGGGITRTETLPGEATRITTTASDGSLLSVSGTAAHPRTYSYEEESGLRITKETFLGEDDATSEWVKTYTDMAGRTDRIEASGRGTITFTYNTLGQLESQTDADGVVTRFVYNDRGELETTGIDLDRDGELGAGDPATTVTEEVVGSVLRRTTTEASEAGLVTTSQIDQALTSRSATLTRFGLETSATTSVTGATRTETITLPDESTLERVFTNGRLASEVHSAGEETARSATYEHDDRGRLWKIVDGRADTETVVTYYDSDLVETITEGSQTVTYQYDDLGHRTNEVLPGDRTVTRSFLPTGEVEIVGGSAAYPVSFTYHPQGRVRTMTTASGTTTWAYDPVTGLLASKTDADEKAVEWSYTLAGRVDTRTGARNLVTDYGYDDAGRLDSINYSDSTPDVGILYDQRNRPSQITDAAGTRVPQYSAAGQFEGETITGGVLDGFSVATGYDELLRKDAFSVSRGSTVLAESGWGYDALSRMESVTQGADSATSTYHANSSLPDTLTHKRGVTTALTTGKTFDELGRLDVLTHTPSTGPPVVFDYAYNAAGLRDTITSADDSLWTVGYNDRGEVTSGVRKTESETTFPGQEFGYQFDGIGNRLTATVNGRVSTYTPDTVNAYESRTVPGYVNILGEAASNSTVTVNGTAAERLGNYFRAELAVTNTAAPVQATVTTIATRDEETVSVTSQRFVPKTPETFTHDDDGNLTSDGRWENVWDAENRLVEQTATASSVAAGAKNLRLAFAYDYAGRRINKTVSEWDGSGWAPKYSLNFLYDGWNLVAEVAVSGGPIIRSYAWGGDLSGGDAAGGIGGLTFIRFHLEGKTLAVAADAQGNTAALYDMEDAALAATYEYGPFGEPLRASGPFAAVNPFRFSTKYEDAETGWLYYGYRYYTPATGRWASQDPIGEMGGLNLLGFVGNDPVNFVDPWGLSEWGFYQPNPFERVIGFFYSDYREERRLDALHYALTGQNRPTPAQAAWRVRQADRDYAALQDQGPLCDAAALEYQRNRNNAILGMGEALQREQIYAQPAIDATLLAAAVVTDGAALRLRFASLRGVTKKTTTVLGSGADVAPYAGKPGFNVLNMDRTLPLETRKAINIQWLDEAIGRGDDILLKTDPIKWDRFMRKVGKESFYNEVELPHLLQRGVIDKVILGY